MSLKEFGELYPIRPKSAGQLFHCSIVLGKKEFLYSVVEVEIQRHLYWWFARVLLSAVTRMFSVGRHCCMTVNYFEEQCKTKIPSPVC